MVAGGLLALIGVGLTPGNVVNGRSLVADLFLFGGIGLILVGRRRRRAGL